MFFDLIIGKVNMLSDQDQTRKFKIVLLISLAMLAIIVSTRVAYTPRRNEATEKIHNIL